MLADDRQLAHIVDFKKRSLIPFDPWSGEDFWLPYDAPHRHEIDLPFRLSSRALQEQKYLDRWRAQAELAFMLRHPWRSLFSLVKQRVFGARFTTATLQRLFPERDLYAFRTMSDRQRSRRRQLRALVNGRGRISNQSLDIG
jgi:hypothetical protein